MLDIWQSLHLICNNNKDYTSLIALSRVIIDNYAFLHLLFIHTTVEEERETRLLLYVLDGLRSRRKDVLLMKHNYDPQYITEKEAYVTKKQCEESVESDNTAEKQILQRLTIILKGEINQKLIDKSDWRFKDYKLPKSKENSFSWTELYSLFASENGMTNTYMGYFSQFVHGLGVSNMQYGIIDGSDFIYNVGISIMDYTKKLVYNILHDEIIRYNVDFKISDAFKIQLELYCDYLKNKQLTNE